MTVFSLYLENRGVIALHEDINWSPLMHVL